MSLTPLTADKEAEAQELAARIRTVLDDEAERIARLLVGKDTKDLFGQTEFDLRDLLLRIGAKAYELHLAEKKTATRVPASSARTASKPPSSKTTGRRRR
jgi:hypothetical protein